MPQVKITIDDKIYKQLKKVAKENFRTITNELNYRLQQSFTTPAPAAPVITPKKDTSRGRHRSRPDYSKN